jgi:KDO2-lipid IV(A) lauroyltransferase
VTTPRGTVVQRARVGLIEAVSAVVRRLPPGAIDGLALVGGELVYRLNPRRTARARRNLERVVGHLATRGLGGPRVAAAARDPRALERIVRLACRQGVHYYLDVIRTPLLDEAVVRDRLAIDTPETIEAALADGRSIIIVGLHFGAIELSARYLAIRTGRDTVAPMETLADPELQAWMVRSRGRVGVRIVGLREARRELAAALKRGEAVGLVADRDLTGGGIEVPFFGAPAPLPAGPALLLLEAEVPIYVAAVRRLPGGRYRGRLEPVEIPVGGTRRERLTEVLARTAETFERLIADAPEQWWAVFFPIWPDLEAAAGSPMRARPPEPAR